MRLDSAADNFARGKTDSFVVRVPTTVGKLTSATLRSDGAGDAPAWFCDSVVVSDPESQLDYHFSFGVWLDGKTDATAWAQHRPVECVTATGGGSLPPSVTAARVADDTHAMDERPQRTTPFPTLETLEEKE
eukprot:6205180-Pleurochrysis_carterae.AAC.3